MKLIKNTLNSKIIGFNNRNNANCGLGFVIESPYVNKFTMYKIVIAHRLLIDLDRIYNIPYKETNVLGNYIRYREYV